MIITLRLKTCANTPSQVEQRETTPNLDKVQSNASLAKDFDPPIGYLIYCKNMEPRNAGCFARDAEHSESKKPRVSFEYGKLYSH